MRPDQLPLLTSLSAPSLSPDGSWAVVSATRPDFAADGYVGQLWRVPTSGEEAPRRITRGFRDTNPQVSPDGRLIAFHRSVPGKPAQLAIVDARGGEPQLVTDAKLGVGSFTFSPDGRTLAYVSRMPDAGRYGDVEDITPGQEDPRSFTGNRLQANGIGWYRDRPAQLFTIEVPDLDAEPPVKPVGRAAQNSTEAPEERDVTGASNPLVPTPTRITEDHTDWSDPAFTPDGTALVATAARHETLEDDLLNDLWLIPLDGGSEDGEHEPRRLTGTGDLGLSVNSPVVIGETVFFHGRELGESRRDFVGNHSSVWAVDLRGETTPRRLTDRELTVGSDLIPWSGEVSGKKLGEGVLFTDVRRGTGRLFHVSANGTTTPLSDGTEVAHAPATASQTIVCTITTERSMGELAVLRDDSLQPLTDFSARLHSETTIVEPIELTATAPDGYPVHGWAYLPEGEGPHPVILNIHGGPYSSYGKEFFDEVQVYVEAGYAVVQCNPRGSWGYGSAHGRAIKGDMGNLDMVDILAFLDHATSTHPIMDAERVGIMGGSYGGYMTASIIAHDHRWKGAIVERGFLDPWSFIGSSDIGWFFPLEYTSYDRSEADRQSPMTHVNQVTTPTLVIHSEQDLRCPLHQAMQYYTLLRANGVDAELLVFPGENHELSRSGTPWHRRQRFEKILAFWADKLPVESR